MSDSDRKVDRNIYPDTVTRDGIRLIDPESGQLGTIRHCLLEWPQRKDKDKKSSFFHWGYSSKQWRIVPNRPLLGSIRRIPSRVTASGYIYFGQPFGHYPTFYALMSFGRKKLFSMSKECCRYLMV